MNTNPYPYIRAFVFVLGLVVAVIYAMATHTYLSVP